MAIRTTGNRDIDGATGEIALALRAQCPGKRDQHYYDEAMRLRCHRWRARASLTTGTSTSSS